MFKGINKIDYLIISILVLNLFFGSKMSFLTHLIEFILIFNLFANRKVYGNNSIIIISLIFLYGFIVSFFTNFTYFLNVYYFLIIPLVFYFYALNSLNLEKLIKILVILSICSFVMLFFSFQTLEQGFEYKQGFYVSESSRVYGHFITGKLLGGTDAFLFSLPIVLCTFLVILKKMNIFLIVSFFGAIAFILAITQTRSGLIFLLPLFISFFTIRYNFKLRTSFFIFLPLFIIFYLILDLNALMPERLSLAYSISVGLNNRDYIWGMILLQILNNPFGNTERIVFDYLQVSAHNSILEFFYSLGWFFGALFLVFYFKNTFMFIKNIFNKKLNLQLNMFSLIMLTLFLYLNIESVPESNQYAFFIFALFTGFYFNIINKYEFKKRG